MKRYKVFITPRLISFLSLLSPIDIELITFSPFIFSKHDVNPMTENHEVIHIYQTQEISMVITLLLLPLYFFVTWKILLLLVLITWFPFLNPFLFLYLVFYLFGLIKYKDTNFAYDMILFEQEAYLNEENLGYLKNRLPFAWARYKI